MADALTSVTNFINSPPGQLAAGAVLAGVVWKSCLGEVANVAKIVLCP